MTTEEKITKEYELAFLGQEENVAEKTGELVARIGGEVYVQGPVERIALEYKIKKAANAYFGWFHLRMTPAQAEVLKKDLVMFAPVLRSLLITPPFVKGKPRSPRPMKPGVPSGAAPAPTMPETPRTGERKPETLPLSNEALEKKIEEILNQ